MKVNFANGFLVPVGDCPRNCVGLSPSHQASLGCLLCAGGLKHRGTENTEESLLKKLRVLCDSVFQDLFKACNRGFASTEWRIDLCPK